MLFLLFVFLQTSWKSSIYIYIYITFQLFAPGAELFTFYIKIRKIIKDVLKTKNVAVGRIRLPHQGWGWEGGDYVYKPNLNFHEMTHIHFCSPLSQNSISALNSNFKNINFNTFDFSKNKIIIIL